MKLTDPGTQLREEMEGLIQQLQESLAGVIRSTDDRIALPPESAAVLADFDAPLPEHGCGASQTIEKLLMLNEKAGSNTTGPRCYHFVIGGTTPASLAADILATAYDAVPYTWLLSPAGVRMEQQALAWLRKLFGLPANWTGVIVTGASMANFVCLAAARQWCSEQQGFDVSETGLAGALQMPVLYEQLGNAVAEDGRFPVGTSKIGPRTIFRPAFSNWRTRNEDVEYLATVAVELDRKILNQKS